jgi:predicted transporter
MGPGASFELLVGIMFLIASIASAISLHMQYNLTKLIIALGGALNGGMFIVLAITANYYR